MTMTLRVECDSSRDGSSCRSYLTAEASERFGHSPTSLRARLSARPHPFLAFEDGVPGSRIETGQWVVSRTRNADGSRSWTYSCPLHEAEGGIA